MGVIFHTDLKLVRLYVEIMWSCAGHDPDMGRASGSWVSRGWTTSTFF